ncbi:ATPase [Pseudoalteromonas phage H101]|uniref:Uncharacterized protein n=1 Tax=Pseudoalteromonas phage H101 TaxID=1654919 RepID=A0A0H4IP16_9CAUD|nr:ATPase [Pseudoalteromonas phage H101]AKO61082.1 hypothetical protein [Pseudoalteromonas phage H101]
MIKLLQAKEDIYWEDSLPDQKPFCKKGGWKITRFSNQDENTSTKKRPFENWKRDIGLGKFIRSTAKSNAIMCVIDDISGYLDIKNNLFYYHKKHRGQHTYLCCKVESSLGKGWHFVRENKDSYLVKAYTPEEKGMVAKEDVLASFSVPVDNKDIEQQESSKGEGEVSSAEASVWTDKHYDFTYTLTEEDIEAGEIKIDPYFVADQWKLGEKDNSGVIFHILKTCSRYKCKHKEEREIKAIYGQIKRLAEMRGVTL